MISTVGIKLLKKGTNAVQFINSKNVYLKVKRNMIIVQIYRNIFEQTKMSNLNFGKFSIRSLVFPLFTFGYKSYLSLINQFDEHNFCWNSKFFEYLYAEFFRVF